MIFNKGDQIIFDGYKRECVCCDKETAIFGTVIQNIEENIETVNYEYLFAISNQEGLRDTLNFEFVGGKLNG